MVRCCMLGVVHYRLPWNVGVKDGYTRIKGDEAGLDRCLTLIKHLPDSHHAAESSFLDWGGKLQGYRRSATCGPGGRHKDGVP